MRDLDQIFDGLARSPFRRRFRLGAPEWRVLDTKGLATVLAHGRVFVDSRLAPARPARDGRQTPFRGHPVFVAQHATGTCCRSCLEKWHGIPRFRELSEKERAHVLAALERWMRGEAHRQDRPASHASPAP